MILDIAVNGEDADAVYNVELDGVEYRLRLQWIEEVPAWFLSLYSSDGSAILLTRRITPGSAPILSARGPAGLFFVNGDPSVVYERLDLGDTVRLFYIEAGTTFEEAFGGTG